LPTRESAADAPGAVAENCALSSPATAADLDLLAGVIEQTMAAANYSPSIMRRANRHDLHLLLRRLTLTQADAKRTLGVFRRILWSLGHRGADR